MKPWTLHKARRGHNAMLAMSLGIPCFTKMKKSNTLRCKRQIEVHFAHHRKVHHAHPKKSPLSARLPPVIGIVTNTKLGRHPSQSLAQDFWARGIELVTLQLLPKKVNYSSASGVKPCRPKENFGAENPAGVTCTGNF